MTAGMKIRLINTRRIRMLRFLSSANGNCEFHKFFRQKAGGYPGFICANKIFVAQLCL